MHRDFHYWATFMAARAAGVRSDMALEIAEHAELVDEAIEGKGPDKNTYIDKNNDNFHWKAEYWTKDKHVQRTASAVLSKEFVQKGKNRGPWHALTWTAFHFLPNLDPQGTASDYFKKYEFDPELVSEHTPDYRSFSHVLSKGKKDKNLHMEQQLICYPNSTLAKAFVEDLKTALKADGSKKVEEYIENSLYAQERQVLRDFKRLIAKGDIDPIKFKIALMGVKMHVYADLWAHQGFVAARSPRCNDVKGLVVGYDFSSMVPWKNDPKPPGKEKFFAGKVASHYGHGNAIRYPDQPGYLYEYVRPFDKKLIQRNNPVEFAAAYASMVELFKLFKDSVGGEKEKSQYCPGEIGVSYFKAMKDYDKVARNNTYHKTITKYDKQCAGSFIDTKLTGDYDLIAVLRAREGQNLPYFALAALCHLTFTEKSMDKAFGGGHGAYHKWIGQNLMYDAKKKVGSIFGTGKSDKPEKHSIPAYDKWLKLSSAHGKRAAHDLSRIDQAVKEHHTKKGEAAIKKSLEKIYDLCRSWLRKNQDKSRKRTEAVLFLTHEAAYLLDHLDEAIVQEVEAPKKKKGFFGFGRK